MRFPVGQVGIVAMILAIPVSARAQLTARLAAGAIKSGNLITDDALGVTERAATSPSVAAALTLPTGTGEYRIVLEGGYSRSAVLIDDRGQADRLAPVTQWTVMLLVEGRIAGPLKWQAGGGAIFYRPSERQGIFQTGGVRKWLVGGGLRWTQPLNSRWNLDLTGRIDTHQFTTPTLRSRDYGSTQSVQRFSLRAGIERVL